METKDKVLLGALFILLVGMSGAMIAAFGADGNGGGESMTSGNVVYELVGERDEIIKLLISFRESFLDELVDRVVDMWDVR